MSKIQSLTPEQELEMIAFREKWRKIGLSTGPANLRAIRPTIDKFYMTINKKPPIIWHCKSPLTAVVVINLWANLWDNLWANLGDNLRDNSKIEFIPTSLWGSLDSNWISFYLYPHEKLRPMHTDDQMIILNHWKNLAENSFWWYPFENVCFVCDRPIFIGMDDRWRMHNDSGPAVTFSDGWKIYAVHGVMVPEYVIERPQEITVSKIDAETNVEIRRVMIDQIGAENYLFASGSKIYIEDDFGTLFRREVANDELIVIVEVKNSTPEQDGTYKNYYLRVPPDMATPRQAIAWTFGLQEHEYKPEVQS